MSRFVMSKTPWERCVYPALKAVLEKTDYNQTTLAAATGISASVISRYVKGDIDPTVQNLLRLEEITGMTFRQLFGECEGRR
jgi:transcriptional regulator with XRE-family HTH domain